MADQMTSFDVIWWHYQQKWYHLLEQAQCVFNVCLFYCALTERKEGGSIDPPPLPLVPRWGYEGGMSKLVRPEVKQLPLDFVGANDSNRSRCKISRLPLTLPKSKESPFCKIKICWNIAIIGLGYEMQFRHQPIEKRKKIRTRIGLICRYLTNWDIFKIESFPNVIARTTY